MYDKSTTTYAPICCVIEDAYHPKKIFGKTRIPNGRYQLKKRYEGRIFEKMKQRFGFSWVVEICNVPNYQGILVHPGNSYEDTEGCLLPCEGYHEYRENLIGENSKEAYQTFIAFMQEAFSKGEVWIEVARDLMQVL
jgi:hypothetical protein